MTYTSKFVKSDLALSFVLQEQVCPETEFSFHPLCYSCQVLLGIQGINLPDSGDQLAGLFGFHTNQHQPT